MRKTAMRILITAAACLAVTLSMTVAASPAKGKGKRPFEQLKYPKLHDITMPKVVRETLPNGMKVIFVEDHELPVVRMKALVRGGRVAEPDAQPALAALFGEVQRTGGVASMNGDRVDEFLERIGASIETGVSDAYGTVSAEMLEENVDQVLPLYAEFLERPAFSQDKIDLAKKHLYSAISRRNDQPMGIGRREILKLIYGASSPYASQFEYDDVDKLTRDDLVAFHDTYYRPDDTILAVWGDFSTPDMKKKVADAFGGWKAEGPRPKIAEPFIFPPAPSVNYVEKKDVEQTFILMGHLGLRLDDPDYPAVNVLSEILGGSMSSRMFVQIRTLKGLAYGAGGFMVPAYDHPGAFFFYTSTKPSTTVEALQAMLTEIDKIRQAPVTQEELEKAKDGYLNTYAFDFDSTDKIVNRLLIYDFYGYPADFNTRLRNEVEKVTREDVLRVAKKDLRPGELSILAIGNAAKFDKPLSAVGKVHTIDITIPEPTPKVTIPAATPESLKAGTDLLLKAAGACGEKALRGLKDLSIKATTTLKTPMGEMSLDSNSTFVLPNRLYSEIKTPMGTMTRVLDADKAWMAMGPKSRTLPESASSEMRRGLYTEAGCAMLLKDVLDGKLKGQALGKASFEGRDATQVVIRLDGKPLTLFLTPDGTTILGLKEQATTQEGPAEVTTVLGGWKTVSGLRLPTAVSEKVKGEVKATTTVREYQVNPAFSEDLFKKPAGVASKS